jgi:ATP-binding cassette subfamily B protein
MSATVHDGLSGVTLARIFGREGRYETLLGQSISSHVRAGLKATRLEAAYSRTVDMITSVGTTLVLILGVHEVWRGALSPGDLLIFFSYLRTAYKPVRDVADVSARLAKATACGERIREILDMPVAGVDKPGAISARGLRGEIRFRGLSFAYRPGEAVLRGLDLLIPAGRTTALVGPNGAGKSTIGKLLLRLYEPEAGEILVDGCPIRDYRVRSLRDQISVLAQESFLLRMSVRENIAFSRPGAAFEEIVAAARWVGAHEFIERLPEGYDTLVGESGQTLSGGQRQRIAFARAALRDARILIFDEPASGLDPESERAARQALAAIKENRTVLLITHRLGLLDLADQLAFIEGGRLVEAGVLADLLAQGERFSAFYRSWENAHATHRRAAVALGR